MCKTFSFSLVVFIAINLFSISLFAQASFQGLGDLPGGVFSGRAYGVSADGSAVVGYSHSSQSGNGYEAFRWTADSGMVGLGDLPGAGFWSTAYGVSADGSVVVGYGEGVSGTEAFRWTEGGGIVGLGDLPGSDFNSSASSVSADGSVVVGTGRVGNNEDEAFRWTMGGGMVGLGDLPGGSFHSTANSVSADGSVVVGFSASGNGNEAFIWMAGSSMVGLGDLPGGTFSSNAVDISADGSVVVGIGSSVNGTEGFRWTEADSMVALGDLPGGILYSIAYGVSSDGSVVVGRSVSGNGYEAFIWTDLDGMRSLKQVLETDYGLDLTGWVLTDCWDVSDDGTVLVGYGTNPDGNTEAWRAVIPSNTAAITNPKPYGKWIAGETDTIKWTETGWFAIKIKCVLNLDTPLEDTLLIEDGVVPDSTLYVWALPDTLLSYRSKIIIENEFDSTEIIESGVFRIKPYVITRLNSDSTYYAYKIERDKWGFGNNQSDMWPPSWYNQFNYSAIDPFTGGVYPNWVGGFVFTFASSADHVDWVSWVNTFSVDACYKSTSLGIYSPTALIRWNAKKGDFNGSCFGIAAANALAFSYKQQFLASYPSFPSFSTPITVPSDTGVKRVVNELFTYQFGNPSLQAGTGRWNVITPNQTLNEIKAMLKEDTVSIRTLSLWNNNGKGGHNILAYGLEQDGTQKELYYVFVYDNAHPNNNNALILIDTTGNSNQGTWLTTYGWTNWGGPKKLMLEIESIKYLTDPVILPKNNSSSISPFILGEDQLEITPGINSNSTILDMLGNKTGFINGQVFEEIPESVPLMYLNGSETPPYGYYLPTDDYSVVLNEFEEDTIAVYFFAGNKSFSYKRYGADQTQTDRLYFDGGVSATNPDAQSKTVKLLNIINETTREKLFVLRSIDLAQNDSVKIVNPDDSTLNFISYGSAKNYQVELNYASSSSLGRFVSNSISLTQNSTHQMVPDWSDFEELLLTIYIDEGNNGTIDDTLEVVNALSAITFPLSVSVDDGWNMVSVPGVNPDGQGVGNWWSGKDPAANVFKYNSGYQIVDSAQAGEGYWMKHSGANTYNTGDEWPAGGIEKVSNNPIAGTSGWNLIGGYENTVATSGLTTTPPGLIDGPVYEYSTGYQVATNLVSGYGYWIKLAGDGDINIPAAPLPLSKSGGDVGEYFKEDWGRITITDAAGGSSTLYAVKGEVNLNSYELPPLPPAGMFDIRFGSGRIVEDLNSAIQTIDLSGVTYPLVVMVENIGVTLQDESGKALNEELNPGDELTISIPFNKLVVRSSEYTAPVEYQLEQNYPNPFNPATNIKYSIPKASFVQLKVYDILGNEVATLVNEEQSTGIYRVELDASALPSGVYFYRIQADSFVDTKKMILVK